MPQGHRFNPNNTTEIFLRFKEGLKIFDIEYLNFNHYEENGSHKITIRFDLPNEKAKERAEGIADSLRKESLIDSFEMEEGNPPKNVKSAHELASQIALKLYSSSEFVEEVRGKKSQFVLYFLKVSFEKMGFRLYVPWSSIMDYYDNQELDKKVVKITSLCIDDLKSKKQEFKDPDFFERFIHLLLNCSFINGFDDDGEKLEKQLWSKLVVASAYKHICDNLD